MTRRSREDLNMTVYSLAYLTSVPFSPADALVLAGKLGYRHTGVRIAPASPGGDFSPLSTDAVMLRETIARAKDSGATVFDVEIARLAADFKVEAFARFLETCGALGARAILVAGDDPDESRLTASFAAFCDAAAKYGLTADLEFMPWTKVPNARAALRVVSNAGRPNGRILVDTLHAGRSATTLADIAAIPRAMLSYAQLCDAPGEIPATHEGLIHTARNARLLPGEGGIDLVGILSQLPVDLPISLEIPHAERLPALGPEEWGRQALAAAKIVVAKREAIVAKMKAGTR
jgi:sugar phosphate isomerase/epimerase